MAISFQIKLMSAIVFTYMVATNTPRTAEAAMTCGTVTKNVAQCITFLKGGTTPTTACCNGIKTLYNLASTPADRKTACGCLKSAAGSIKGIDYSNAKALPSKCGVKINYAISPTTDCSKVN